MADPDNSQIDADIVDYLLGNGEDYSDYVSNTGAEFLSNIKLAPPDLGAPKTSSSVKGQSSRGSASVKASRQDDEKGDEYGIEEEQAGENDQLDLSNYNGVDKYDSDAPYDASVRGKKSLGEAVWLHEKDCVELLTLRGNYWRVMGWSEDRTMLLNPEEALLLVERGQLRVKASVDAEKHIPCSLFYKKVLEAVPLAVYLIYSKLKSLDYVVMRHKYRNCDKNGKNYSLKAFSCDAEIHRVLKNADPKASLLETVVAFDVYPNTSSWSKKIIRHWSIGNQEFGKPPCGHIIALTGDWTINGRLMAYLLRASKGVPIICAAVLPSGSLILEEFTDGRQSLNWNNEYAIDITYRSKVSMGSVIPERMRPKAHTPHRSSVVNTPPGGGDAAEKESAMQSSETKRAFKGGEPNEKGEKKQRIGSDGDNDNDDEEDDDEDEDEDEDAASDFEAGASGSEENGEDD